ncbi:MAG: hypothetical protein EAX95_05185 [Candidatus Thorarchaeota archaeon]|nr:hypothetical protein [Candidatus Thorarchaeota archaeon]
MSTGRFSFAFLEKEIRKKTFGVLTVIDTKGRPHSTGILYGVSPPTSKFCFYVMSDENYAKSRYIRHNPYVSLVVTFPHYYLRLVPASYAMFRGTAELVSKDNEDARWAFRQKRILRMSESIDPELLANAVFIKMNPERTVYCFGIGIGLMELRSSHTAGGYKVTIPADRLA